MFSVFFFFGATRGGRGRGGCGGGGSEKEINYIFHILKHTTY